MAYSIEKTRVANPAGKVKKNMAKKRLSPKQIKYFGTPRQKAALKAKRSKPKMHKKRTAPRPNPSTPKKKYKLKKKSTSGSKSKTRKNSPEIISFLMGNPGPKKKGGKKKMASKKAKYKKSASKKNAGYSKSPKKKMTHKKKRNPAGLGRPMDWLKGGVGVIAGGVGTRVLPQLAGASNTGAMGYAMNAGVAIGLAWAAHAFLRDSVITASVAAGGFAALFLRVIGDNTSYGQALSLSGFGDYMVSNWITPQRITDPRQAMFENGIASPGIGTGSVMGGGDSYAGRNDGNSF